MVGLKATNPCIVQEPGRNTWLLLFSLASLLPPGMSFVWQVTRAAFLGAALASAPYNLAHGYRLHDVRSSSH